MNYLKELKDIQRHNSEVIRDLITDLIDNIPLEVKMNGYLDYKENTEHKKIFSYNQYLKNILRPTIAIKLLSTKFNSYMKDLSKTDIAIILDLSKLSLSRIDKEAISKFNKLFKDYKEVNESVYDLFNQDTAKRDYIQEFNFFSNFRKH